MKEPHLRHLVCPRSLGPLRLDVATRDDDEIIDGVLRADGGEEYPIRGGIQGAQLGMFLQEESVRSQVHAEDPAHVCCIFSGLNRGAEDHHVHRHTQADTRKGIFSQGDQFAHLFGTAGLIRNLGDLSPYEGRAFLLTSFVKFLIPFAITALVNEKIINRCIVSHLFLDQVGIL